MNFAVRFGAPGAEIGRHCEFANEAVKFLPLDGTCWNKHLGGLVGAPWRRDHASTLEAPLSDLEPIVFPGAARRQSFRPPVSSVTFDRGELLCILDLYGRKVAAGEWRDYAIAFLRDRAVFAVFHRAAEVPLYRIEKVLGLARRQGAYAVVSASGHVLKRGSDLDRVLRVIDRRLTLVG